jgi:hypothetical protein
VTHLLRDDVKPKSNWQDREQSNYTAKDSKDDFVSKHEKKILDSVEKLIDPFDDISLDTSLLVIKLYPGGYNLVLNKYHTLSNHVSA